MEKIVYSERIRDLIDHLVRIKVIQKKKGYLVVHLKQSRPKFALCNVKKLNFVKRPARLRLNWLNS